MDRYTVRKEHKMVVTSRQSSHFTVASKNNKVIFFDENPKKTREIKEIKQPVTNETINMKQYADYITLVLRDLIEFREVHVLVKLKDCTQFYGLLRDKRKWKAMVIVEERRHGTEFRNMKCADKLKIRRVYFHSPKPFQILEKN